MKKLFCAFLCLLVLASFAACGKKDGDETTVTTTESATTVPVVLTSAPDSTKKPSNDKKEQSTIILTSRQGETMPTVVTDNFLANTYPAVAPTEPQLEFSIPQGNMLPPEVHESKVVSTKPTKTSNANQGGNNSGDAEDQEAEDPTEKSNPISKALDVQDIAVNGEHKIEIAFDAKGWSNGVKVKGEKIEVVDPGGITREVEAKLTGKNEDGCYAIVIDTSDFEEGTVSFTIPEKFVESKDGLLYSAQFEGSIEFKWDHE